ncbi:hypothetical protein D910_09881 [Dendroctonus ponderosae]|uniref:Homeobox domain-containing protein n=1 Tax=Dendroctonus ponderosae TaxID=77166 RepID=U4UJD6_DENPD|nr:hypothetical protein D910_09881 [Dendroctonus ponderosae]
MAAIYQCYRKIVDTIWSPNVWLPPNTTWADIAPESSQEVQHADYRHLFYPLPMALVVLLIRYLFEKYWFAPVGISLGIKSSRPKKAPPIPLLESTYAKSKKWKHKQVQSLAKQLDMSERQVERWLRLRKGQNKPSTLTKFCENAWRCTYYTFSFIYGITEWISSSISDHRYLVVLYVLYGILLVFVRLSILRRKEKGLLADVHTSHCNDIADVLLLDCKCVQGGHVSVGCSRFSRYIFGGELLR